jgi:soluble lytic murein transglycosylase
VSAEKTAEAQESLFWLLETEAYLKRRLGRYTETMRLYGRASELAPVEERERMRWYRYDSLMRIHPAGAVEELLRLTDEWESSAYYDDVLFDLADRLVRSRRWELIARSADILIRSSRSFSAARFSYIAARAAELGYLEAEEEHIRVWYEHAVKSGCGAGAANYYRIMAEERLEVLGMVGAAGDDGWWPFCRKKGRGLAEESLRGLNTEAPAAEPRVLLAADTAKILSGYISFDLAGHAFDKYGDNEEILGKLSSFTVRRWARSLQRRGDYLESVRLLSRYFEASGKNIEREDVHLLYPRAYESIMEEVSEEYGLPDYLMFALVREESLFSADISSSAGAVGLSQLMPSTARDVASRIGVEVDDLTDPELNVKLGGWYLDHLIGRTDSYSQALFSYNGGITRVRRWLRNNPDLPGDLLLEAIPFKETSHYGRKVLVSAVVYGYIYHGIEIREIVEAFFEI